MRVKKTNLFLLIGLMCVLFLFPVHQVQAARATGTVKNRILNVREKAGTSSSIVCKLSQGTKVTIISETTGTDGMKWYSVYFAYSGSTREGYVRADLLNVSGSVPGSSAEQNTDNDTSGDSELLYVKNTSVRVREEASTSSRIIAGLAKDTEVKKKKTKTGTDGRQWTKVSFTYMGEKQYGYIRSDLLTAKNPSGDASDSNNNNNTGNSEKPQNEDILYVNASAVRVRESASDSSKIVANLLQGDKVRQKKTKKGDDGKQWTKVTFEINGDKIYGYIRSDLLTLHARAGEGDETNSSDGEEYRYVTASAVRVRDKASSSSKVVSNLLQGDKVKFKKEKTGEDGKKWTKVSFYINDTRYEGYIRSDYLSKSKSGSSSGSNSSSTDNNTGSDVRSGKIRPAIVNVRAQATTSSGIVAKLSQGSKVTIVSEKTGSDNKKWYKVTCYYNGDTVKGYIRADLVN
ncbi:MAG: SH3 domain-containing protein [Clostridiales bacterium]|nr:SH3 domain-containing protein [Clostridiales bacterium]